MRTVITFILLSNIVFAQPFTTDILPGFKQLTIHQPNDYDGKVTTTLICKTKEGNNKAVLYIHGFSDYFFQTEMAEQYLAHGFDFYAVDLRKYGRSHLPNQRFFDVRTIHEYDADIDTALRVIKHNGYANILLSGHSTGGLIAATYAHAQQGKELFDAVYLNSPFLDMNLNGFTENIVVPFGSMLGAMLPRVKATSSLSPLYGYSIHKSYYGEWDFDTLWKPMIAPAVNFGWTRAIHRAHKEVQKGNCISKPTLIMSSDHSTYEKKWNEKLTAGDAVLDVKDIQTYGAKLGLQTTVIIIPDGLHDLMLSKKTSRERVYSELFNWLQKTLN